MGWVILGDAGFLFWDFRLIAIEKKKVRSEQKWRNRGPYIVE